MSNCPMKRPICRCLSLTILPGCRIGLLPQIPHDRIRFIGNAASLGAKLVLLSTDEREYAANLRDITEHIDLSADPQFQMEFAEGMIFPD